MTGKVAGRIAGHGHEGAAPQESHRRMAEEWCRQTAVSEPGGFARLLAADAVVHGLAHGGEALRGPDDVQSFFEQMGALYPRRACDVLDTVVDVDKVAVRWALHFTPGRGEWRLNDDRIEGMTILALRDGLIAEVWTNFGRWWV